MEKKKQQWFLIILSLGIFCILVGTSYALFKLTLEGNKETVIKTGDLVVTLDDTTNGPTLQLGSKIPITASLGETLEPYTFTIENTGTVSSEYQISIEELALTTSKGRISPESVRYLIINKNTGGRKSNLLSVGKIYTGTLKVAEKVTLELRLWIDENAGNEAQDKEFSGRLKVDATSVVYADNSGAATPELEENMIPVTYNETSKAWTKANSMNVKSNPWYNYTDKQWANAVVVKESGTHTRAYYQTAEIGTEISMDDILQMLVWVPRYKYVMPAAKEGQIDIIFEDSETPKSLGTATGTSYLTHPAFTFGKTELNGLWIGKFESSPDIACAPSDGAQGTNCDLSTINPLIKPNVKSWTGARPSTFFISSRNVQAAGNPYGYNQSGVNSHMMKNSEWGAVAYLTQSKYGRCTDGTCTEVTMNNLSVGDGRTITGCAADTITSEKLSQPDCSDTNRYNTEKGVLASTTGNIYGIYDMAGGDWEYVMGNYNKYSGYTAISYTKEQTATILGRTDNIAVGVWNSGFNGPVYGKALDNSTSLNWTTGIDFPEEKYYDLYTIYNIATSCNGKPCLGHALSETAKWYGDYQSPVSSSNPWFLRGGVYDAGSLTGIFYARPYYGRSYTAMTSRFVISKE